jgi:hypothetical protein
MFPVAAVRNSWAVVPSQHYRAQKSSIGDLFFDDVRLGWGGETFGGQPLFVAPTDAIAGLIEG